MFWASTHSEYFFSTIGMSNILTWRKPNQIHKQYGGTDETYTECNVGYTSIRHGLFYHPFPPVRAGLMRIRFEFEQDPTYGGESRSTGLGFLQFDDPPTALTIPPSASLIVSALLPILGVKKWRRSWCLSGIAFLNLNFVGLNTIEYSDMPKTRVPIQT